MNSPFSHADTMGIYAEQLQGFICAQAAESVGYSVFHAVALETLGQAWAFLAHDRIRSAELFNNAAAFEKGIANRVTGVPHSLLMLNVCDWLIEGQSFDSAYEIAVQMLQHDTLLPYIRKRFEGNKLTCERQGSGRRFEGIKTDLDPQPLVVQGE